MHPSTHIKALSPERTAEGSVWSRRRWLLGAGAGGLLGALPGGVLAQAAAEEAQAPPMPAVGSMLAVPRIERLDGSVYEPAASAGQPLLVYWWASTCPFCALQSPSMEALWRAQRGRGLQMLALSVDRRPQDAQAYLSAKGYTFPAAWTTADWRKTFPKPKGLPITFLRGRDGRLLLAERGQMFAEDVEAMAQLI